MLWVWTMWAFLLDQARYVAEKTGEKQACLEIALVRLEEQLNNHDENVMKAANVSQPVENAVGLPSCRFNFVARYEISMCKVVSALRILNEIFRVAIISYFSWSDAEEVCLFLLSILEQVSRILN